MAQTPAASAAVPVLQLIVKGRVQAVTRHQGANGETFRTLLRTPAPDSYSSPGTFEVRSRRRIGQEGQEVEVACDLLGFARSFSTKAGETVRTAEHVLQAV